MKRLVRLGAGLGMLLALVVATAAPALAETLTIREVDTTRHPEVRISASIAGGTARPQDFTVRENGQVVPTIRVVPLGDTDRTVGVVLVIDVSGSMRQNGKIDAAKAAARQFIASKRPRDQIAIVAFSDKPRVVVNFTADPGPLTAAVDGLTSTGETALWDGVQLGTGLLTDQPGLQPNLVVLSDGKDTVSLVDGGAAKASALSAKAAVYAIGLQGGDFEGGALRDLAGATGGAYAETADPRALGQLYGNVQRSIQNQYLITYTSKATDVVEVLVTAGDTEARASAPVGSASAGTAVNQPEVADKAPLPGFLAGSFGKVLIALLVLAAAGLFVYGMALVILRGRDPSRLEAVLQPYTDADEGLDTGERSEVSLAESSFIRAAVDATGRIASERGVLDVLEKKLEQADLPLRPAEALFFYLAAVAISAVVGLLLGAFMGFVVALALVALLPVAVLNFMAGRRRRKFASQLPDTLQLLAGSLRAGYSLLQGVDAVAQEVDDPMGSELRRVLAEARLGRPLEDALEDAADRMGSADFSWAVMAVRIQREVGGNLAELLDTVSETMISRERLRREVSALTAEGRVSAIVLGILPVAMGFLMYVLNPDYISNLFETGLGQGMLAGSGLLALFGFYWMKKTVEIEI